MSRSARGPSRCGASPYPTVLVRLTPPLTRLPLIVRRSPTREPLRFLPRGPFFFLLEFEERREETAGKAAAQV